MLTAPLPYLAFGLGWVTARGRVGGDCAKTTEKKQVRQKEQCCETPSASTILQLSGLTSGSKRAYLTSISPCPPLLSLATSGNSTGWVEKGPQGFTVFIH